MNDEKSNCMVLKKQKRKHHETNNRWEGEGEELQMDRFWVSREHEMRDPGSCRRPEVQPRLCWVVCLRCSEVPPGMQEERHPHAWAPSFPPLLSPPALSRLQQSSWAAVPSAAATEMGVGAFSIHLLGIFVHPAPGTQGAPDGLFGHS